MQSIMWLILGATVGAAGIVSHFKRQSLKPVLGEPQQIQGISVRLPLGWIDREDESDDRTLIRSHPQFADVLIVSVTRQSSSTVEAETRSTRVKEIDLGGEPSKLVIIRHLVRSGETIPELNVSRNLPNNRKVTISLAVPGARRASELGLEIDLIERIAASVKLDPNY